MKTELLSITHRKKARVVSIGWLPRRRRSNLMQIATGTPETVHSILRSDPDVICLGRGLKATAAEKRSLVKSISASGIVVVAQSAR